MRITPGPLALLLLAAACQPDDTGTKPVETGDSDTDSDTDLDTGEPPPPWQVTGQVGQLFIIEQAGNASVKAGFNVHAMFGDQLQGVATAPWCLAAGLCYSSLPVEDDAFVEGKATKIDAFATQWSWNGHALDIAGQQVPFEYDPIVGYAWYTYEGEPFEHGTELEIEFDGEWGRHRSKVALEPLELLEPVSGIALPARAPTTLRWNKLGDGDSVFLRLKTPDADRLWRLADDGSFVFDPRDFGIADLSPEEYSFSLQRWNSKDVDVHGNTLTVHSIWQQHFDFLTCEPGDYPVGALAPGVPPLVPVMAAERVKVGFQAVIDDGRVHDFFLDDDLDGAPSLFTATIFFEILDTAGQPLCRVVYDASNATHAGAPAASGAGTIFEAWTLGPLSGGQHDCTIIDDAIYGAKDVRQVIQQSTWGIGIGTVADTTNALKNEFDWAAWQGLLAGAYVMRDDVWTEVGGVASSGLEACGTVHSGLQALPKPTQAPVPARFYSATPVVSFSL